jgi:hypothetical protein
MVNPWVRGISPFEKSRVSIPRTDTSLGWSDSPIGKEIFDGKEINDNKVEPESQIQHKIS